MSFTFNTIPLYSIFVCKERQCRHLKYVADRKFECINPEIEASYKCEQLKIWTQCNNCYDCVNVGESLIVSRSLIDIVDGKKTHTFKCTGNPEVKDMFRGGEIYLHPAFLTTICKYRRESMRW